MNLGQLIETLAAHPDQNAVVPQGFRHPHSYRGYYECLAFEPARNVTVAAMLADARYALGNTYQGWKGGDYRMDDGTDVYLAEEGATGDELSTRLLGYMLAGTSTGTATNPPADGLLTLPAEPPEGATVRIEGGSSDGQVWEHVHVGLTPDSAIHWRRTNGRSTDWSRWSGLWWRLTEDDAKGQLGLRIVPKPLAVGDPVETEEQLDALPVGAVVRAGQTYRIGWRHVNDWSTSHGDGYGRRYLLDSIASRDGLRVLDLPTAAGDA